MRVRDPMRRLGRFAVNFDRFRRVSSSTTTRTTPRHVLVVNSGSSSLKCEVVSVPEDVVKAYAIADGIGSKAAIRARSVEEKRETVRSVDTSCRTVLEDVLACVRRDEIDCVAHRVVHGGERFGSATLVDDAVVKDVRRLSAWAPLHNPICADNMEEAMRLYPDLPHVACFDTAFHSTIAESTYLYPLPRSLYRDHRIRKYGFHGMSHQYVSERARAELGLDKTNHGIVTAHLGNGASVCAVKNGQSVNTTMGVTPLEGLMMGTRSGSIDPAIVLYLSRTGGYSMDELDALLHRESGCLGISEHSHDMREIERSARNGDESAELALEMFCERAAQGIAQMIPSLHRLDALVFTGGIGEHSAVVRDRITSRLGVVMRATRAKTLVMTSRESVQMAREADRALFGAG